MTNKFIKNLEADVEHFRSMIHDEPDANPEDVAAWRHELFIVRQKLIQAKKMMVVR
jgi:hypothetical protein